MGRYGGPRHGHGHGAPPWADFVDQRFFERAWGGGGRRMRRGDVRAEVLAALLEGPAHGYEVIRRLEEKSGGMWRPSPGSVYPTLQMLEDAGLVTASERDGRRTYDLTAEGRTEAEQAASQPEGDGPMGDDGDRGARFQVKYAIATLHMAARQVAATGTPEQVKRAADILRQTRQALYQILAED
jgi:DNA-binding PadR family transcriptional regulator